MNLFSLYSILPVSVQNKLCTFRGYQLSRMRYGGNYDAFYQKLVVSDNARNVDVRSYKEAHIFRILDYAYHHCPYYRQSFNEAGVNPSDFRSLEDLQKFPVLTKEQVRLYWAGMISDEVERKELIPYHTSGSTGKALDFYWMHDSLAYYWATVWRGRRRCGIKKGDVHLNFTGKLVVPFSQSPPPIGAIMKHLDNIC